MWLITSPSGQTMYIFGSIHAATPDLYPLSPVIMDAFNRSDYLALETAGPFAASILDIAVLPEGRTAADYIPAELRQRVLDVFQENENYIPVGLAEIIENIDNFHPAIWWNVLSSIGLEKANIAPEYGLEFFFGTQVQRNGMGVIWMEYENNLEIQESILNLSMLLHLQLIEGNLNVNAYIEHTDMLYELWKSGDDQALLDLWQQSLDSFDDAELAREWQDVSLTYRDIYICQTKPVDLWLKEEMFSLWLEQCTHFMKAV